MRDHRRFPDSTSDNLGELCLRAVLIDDRFDDRVRDQARHLLEVSGRNTVASSQDGSDTSH